MKNQFNVNGNFFKKNSNGKALKVNMGGGSLNDAAKELNLEEIEAREYAFHKQYGFCETNNFVSLFLDKEGNVYSRTFMHFNGHMSNYKEGVYEVTFTKMLKSN